ncbi:MAG: PBECR4 domain-containing protein [Bacilli bacterium]
MDKLYKSFIEYQNLLDKEFHYKFKNRFKFKLIFKPENLPHLLGLHKLKDIEILNKFNTKEIAADVIYKKIENKDLTSKIIEKSAFYHKIESRLIYFRELNELVTKNNFLRFSKDKTEDGTLMKAEFIVYSLKNGKYIHLFIGKGARFYYPETFIIDDTDYYIKQQSEFKIKDIKVNFKYEDNDAMREVAVTRV